MYTTEGAMIFFVSFCLLNCLSVKIYKNVCLHVFYRKKKYVGCVAKLVTLRNAVVMNCASTAVNQDIK